MADELKPCPFCGGAASIVYSSGNEVYNKQWSVGCTLCSVQFSAIGSNSWRSVKEEDDAAQAKAIAAWNRRALSHAAGQDGEQCRAASVEDSAVNAVLTTIRRERDAWLSWNHDHPEQAAITTPDVLEMAANLIRAISRGVPEGDDSLPRPLWPVSKEWYQLCERRFAVDRITISGKLAEAIVDAVCGPAIAAQRKGLDNE